MSQIGFGMKKETELRIQSIIYFQGFESLWSYPKAKISKITVDFNITRTDTTLIFETEPQDALPNVWFESADTYSN
jgi:hypothetical protein